MTLADLARGLGISVGIAHKHVHRGMPRDQGIQAAQEWLAENRRPTGRPRGFRPRRVSDPPPAVSAHPTENRSSPGNVARSEGIAESPSDSNPLEFLPGSTPRQLLQRSEQIERVTFGLVGQRMRVDPDGLPPLLRAYNDAQRGLLSIRGECIKAAEREGKLVSGDWMRREVAEHDGLIANLVRAMPRQLAPRVNAADVENAERELQGWVDQFLRVLNKSTKAKPANGN